MKKNKLGVDILHRTDIWGHISGENKFGHVQLTQVSLEIFCLGQIYL